MGKLKQHFTIYKGKGDKLEVLTPSSWLEKTLTEKLSPKADAYVATLNAKKIPYLGFIKDPFRFWRLPLVDGKDFDEIKRLAKLTPLYGKDYYTIGMVSHNKDAQDAVVTLPLSAFIQLVNLASEK